MVASASPGGSPGVQAAVLRVPPGSRFLLDFGPAAKAGPAAGHVPHGHTCPHGRGDPQLAWGHSSQACPPEPPGDTSIVPPLSITLVTTGHGAVWGRGVSLSCHPPPLWMLHRGDPEFNPTYGSARRCPGHRWVVTSEKSPPAGSGEALAVVRGGPRAPCHRALAPSPPRSAAAAPGGPAAPRGARWHLSLRRSRDGAGHMAAGFVVFLCVLACPTHPLPALSFEAAAPRDG